MTSQSPAPRFATPRNNSYATFGPAVAKLSHAIGRPLMPWQELVADVAFEVDSDGRFVHPLVIISVPRQSGKTALVLATAIHRGLTGRNRKIWLTAQTGMAAHTRWREQAEQLMTTPFSQLVTPKWGAGNSRLIFGTGSQFAPHPPTIDALHGEQSDLNIIDEAWSFTETQGTNLIQAITPTQATRPGAQLIITSTMGTADSTWFHNYVERGRDGDPAVCYFEWSIPDDADPTNLDDVARFHPAVGHIINRAAIDAAAGQMRPGEFARAYGNRRTGAGERLVSMDAWNNAQTVETLPEDALVAFGVAVSIDRTETAIVAAALVDGTPVIELVDKRAGTNWAVNRVAQLVHGHPNVGIAIDRFGPSQTIADQLDLRDIELMKVQTRDVTSAAADLLDRLEDRRVKFRTDASFDRSMDVLAKRSVGDAFAFSRKLDHGSIAPVEAASLALWAVARDKGPGLAPAIQFAS